MVATRRNLALRICYVACVALALAYTPVQSAGVLRDPMRCEFVAPLSVWWTGAANLRHVLSYGVLCLLAIASFRRHRVAWGAGTTLAISALVEVEQAVLTHGHCRVRDLAPNAIAVALAMLVWFGWRRARGFAR